MMMLVRKNKVSWKVGLLNCCVSKRVLWVKVEKEFFSFLSKKNVLLG